MRIHFLKKSFAWLMEKQQGFDQTMGYVFKILGSSSSGNCSLLKTEEATILIDAGFSGKQICKMLENAGESIEDVDAVFITHEHSDHCNGVRGLAKYGVDFYANTQTAKAIQSKLTLPVHWKVFESGQSFQFKDLEIQSFSIPHDAYDPVSYIFSWGEHDLFNPHRSLAWVTDLGHATPEVRRRIKNVDYLVLESNHDSHMLENDMKRPMSLKRRILGRHGHLSNADALSLLKSVEKPKWKELFFAHLSKDCNNANLVEDTFAPFCSAMKLRMQVVNPLTDQVVAAAG